MKTKDLLASFRRNKTVASIVPAWSCRSVPVPFFRAGIPYLGFYFYPIRRNGGATHILTPILQFVVGHRDSHVVSAVAAPFFLLPGENAGADLGEYPNPALRGLPFAEAEAAFDRYYAACDRYLEGGPEDEWRKSFDAVREPGLAKFLERFRDTGTSEKARNSSLQPPACHKGASRRSFTARPETVLPERRFPTVLNGNGTTGASPIPSVVSDIRVLLSEPTFRNRIPELDAAVNAFRRDAFHVAVVGEFSRGKSTFLNELIGDGHLPVGDLPTTAIPARIAGGRENKAVFRAKGQPPKVLPLTQAALDAFSAGDDGKDPEGALDITVATSWLQKLPIVLFDSPGVGDAVGKRASLARSAIACCDCTVVVVSASAPCSLTELAFLRDGVVARKVPRVAVLVAKLDMVPEAEREKVLAYVQDRIRPVAPEAEIWVPRQIPGIEPDSARCVGVEAIRQRLAELCSETDVAVRRRTQLFGALAGILTAASNDLSMQEQATRLSSEKREEARRKLEEDRGHFEVLWDEVLAKCETGSVGLENWVGEELAAVRDGLTEDFVHSLRTCPDAKLRQWAEEEFPYRAKREIPRRIRDQFSPKLQARLASLAQETTRLARERLSVSGLDFKPMSGTVPEAGAVGDLAADDSAIRNIQTGANVAKVAAVPVAMLGLFLVGGPVGIAYAVGSAAALGGGLIAGKKAEAKAAELRANLERGVSDEFERLFEKQAKSARELVAKAHEQMQNAVKAQMHKSLDAGLKALDESSAPSTDAAGVNVLRERLDALRERISSAARC